MSTQQQAKILLIDDERAILDSIEGYLEDIGFEVLLAENGEEGLAKYRSEKPDLILVDLRMPGIDGLDVLAGVTKDSPDLPIIVISGTGVLQDAIEALRLGAWDFLTKPIYDMAVLKHSVDKALERAELIRENKRHKAYLEEMVQSRTADLEKRTAELLMAKEAAEEASKAKSAFLTTMSHELRTPMNGVLGMAQLIMNSELTEQQKKRMEVIIQSGQALLKILNEILDLSKIESNKIEIDEVEFHFGDTIERIIHLFSGSASTKGLNLNCHVPVDIPDQLIGDPNRLGQILSNLLANALKFTDEGEIALTIEKIEDGFRKVVLLFKISDSGIGMSKADMEIVFEPFTQVDSSATRKYGGTGLGLTIVKNLVELMGGRIRVESELGKGSTFYVVLEFNKGESSESGPEQNLMVDKKVLLVDSDTAHTAHLTGFLSQWGLHCKTAECGEDGLQRITHAKNSSDQFDVVVINRQLTDWNGIELIQALKNRKLFPVNKTILVTGQGYDEVCKEFRKIGGRFCLKLPIIKTSTLFNAMVALLVGTEKPTPTLETLRDEPSIVAASRHLMVVEDDVINQMVIVGMLQNIGFTVDVASNGKEALNLFQPAKYDLIFMDCLMPEMDGFEATRHIREKEAASDTKVHVPIIAFTAKAMKGDREQCLAAGMDDYLAKPVTIENLKASIKKHLST